MILECGLFYVKFYLWNVNVLKKSNFQEKRVWRILAIYVSIGDSSLKETVLSPKMNAIVDTSNGEISCCLKFVLNAPQIVIADLQIWQDVYQILNAKCSVKKKWY